MNPKDLTSEQLAVAIEYLKQHGALKPAQLTPKQKHQLLVGTLRDYIHQGKPLSFAEFAAQNLGVDYDTYHAARSEAEQQALGRSPSSLRVSRQTWDAMNNEQRSDFARARGEVYDDPKPVSRGIVKAFGKEISREDFDRLAPQQQSDFLLGKSAN